MIDILRVELEDDVEIIRELFIEYFEWLDDETCFPDFDDELTELPGEYAPPKGQILLAREDDWPIGCVALREFQENVCEMKRLYVRDEFKGKGIGKTLIVRLIDEARHLGYRKMVLDTLPYMKQAIHLYQAFGFKEIDAYGDHPVEGAIYMEMEL